MLGKWLGYSIGIDISDRSIEVVKVFAFGGRMHIRRIGRTEFAAGIIEGGRIRDVEKALQAVKAAFVGVSSRSIAAHTVILSLPESHVYPHVFTPEVGFMKLKRVERDGLVLQELSRTVPLERGNLAYSYRVRPDGSVITLAAPRDVMIEWQNFFRKLHISISFFDGELLASFRALYPQGIGEPVCVVDIGSTQTRIAIFDQESIRYSDSVPVGGDMFTSDVRAALKEKQAEAEDRKITLGLTETTGQDFFMLVKGLEPIAYGVRQALAYAERSLRFSVKRIILVGGTSRLSGLADYFATNVGIPTEVGTSRQFPKLEVEYMGALGAAFASWNRRDPLLSPRAAALAVAIPGTRRTRIFFWGLSIAVIALIGVGIMRWVQRERDVAIVTPDDQTNGNAQGQQFSKFQSVDISLQLITDQSLFIVGRAKGRFIEYTVETATDYKEAVVLAAVGAEKELKEAERLWSEPLNASQTTFPLKIEWLAYNTDEISALSEVKLKELNTTSIPYRIDDARVTKLVKGNQANLYEIIVTLSLAVNDPIIIQKPPELSVREVVVLNTETGWLNIRSGPGTTFDLLKKAIPGERYPWLGEEREWFKVKLQGGEEGWASKKYFRFIE
ncbi:MAG: pilus assembly protein PilM [Patescibacteria group bacterium]